VWILSALEGRVYRVTNDSLLVQGVKADSAFSLIATGVSRLLAVRSASVYELSSAPPRFTRIAELEERDGAIVGLAELGGAIVAVQQRDTVLRVVRLQRDGPQWGSGQLLHQRISRGIRVRASSDSTILVTDVVHPFALREMSPRGAETWAVSRPLFGHDDVLGASVTTLAALPLDCDRTLQVLANLRNDDRWFALYERARLVRTRRVSHPLGFSTVVPGRYLLGYDDSPNRSGVVMYQWRWETLKPE
jgi:hypothetical protein